MVLEVYFFLLQVCKIRSWQSMKERYLKHIKFDLTTGSKKFPFLTREDLKILRQGYRLYNIYFNIHFIKLLIILIYILV